MVYAEKVDPRARKRKAPVGRGKSRKRPAAATTLREVAPEPLDDISSQTPADPQQVPVAQPTDQVYKSFSS